MELFDHLALGFHHALTLQNLGYAFAGCFLGTLIGVLPGVGPLVTIATLLPFTYGLPPLASLIMLAGIYYGAQYGGSTTAILVNLPGEASSVVTVLDGYQMARQGRAGVALTTAALGSFFAGCVGTLVLAAFAVPLSEIALSFHSAEYFSLMVLGLVGAVAMSASSLAKSLAMIIFGILLGLVGLDLNSGVQRFTFSVTELWDGIDFVVVAMGVFALAEIAVSLEAKAQTEILTTKILTLWPTREDFRRMAAPIVRGTALGAIIGILPGVGPAVASFGAYAVERKISKTPEQFGKGAIEGVAAPEAANNAAAQTHFIPTLALGIPASATMALMLGAMMIHNIQPGPRIITNDPGLFWGLVASMWIGNLMLLILNLPLVGIWVKLLRIPYRMLYPGVLAFCCIGVYSVGNSAFNVYLTAIFGLVGYVLIKLKCEPAPLMLGFVLGPMLEENFRRAMVLAKGDLSVFVTRPISLTLLCIAALLIFLNAMSSLKLKRMVKDL